MKNKETKQILESYCQDIIAGKYEKEVLFRCLEQVFNLGYKLGETDTHENYRLGMYS